MELRDDLSYVAHENTDKVVHLIIPAKPTELSDEDLAHVAGGTYHAPGASGAMARPRQAAAVATEPLHHVLTTLTFRVRCGAGATHHRRRKHAGGTGTNGSARDRPAEKFQ